VNRRVVLFALVAAVAVLAGWYLFLWSPTKSDLDNAKARTDAAAQRQQQLQAEIRRLQEAQRNEPQNRAKLETLRTAIPDDPALGQFIIDLNDAATKSGIDFISIAPSEPRVPAVQAVTTTTVASGTTPTTAATGTTGTGTGTTATGPAPAEVAVQLQMRGGYFQMLDFLNRLDVLPRLVVTDSLNVTADDKGALTVAVTARIFVRAVPAGFAGALPTTTTSTTVAGAGGATTTTVAGATTTTAAGGAASTTTTTAGATP
jgi:Tfp pilus assembly protein PilO